MRALYLLFLGAMTPTLALADIEPTCEELWFSRNAMLDDAGYCFSTPLGRALFDNADCTTQSPKISPDVAEQIARIQVLETQAPYVTDGICNVDVNQTSLPDVSEIDLRRRLTFQPSTDGGSSACIGFRGETITLHAAPDATSDVMGVIPVNAVVSSGHLPWKDWNFAIAWPPDESGLPTVLGWYHGYIMEDAAFTGNSVNCFAIAG